MSTNDSATAPFRPTAPASLASAHGVSFGGILRSEWIKLISLRSTIWCLSILFVLNVGLAAAFAGLFAGLADQPGSATSGAGVQALAAQTITFGIGFSSLVSSVLGVLVISGEYGTGMIRSTLTAVPRRLPALVGKIVVFGVTTLVVSAISFAIAAPLVAAIFGTVGISVDLGDGALWLALISGAAYLALISTIALSLGCIIRSSAGAIAAIVGLVLVLPNALTIIASATQSAVLNNLGEFLPSTAGTRLYGYTDPDAQALPLPEGFLQLEPWQGGLVIVGWFILLFVLAAVLLKRRDA